MSVAYDAVIVGAGPNGLAAAAELAAANLSTLIVEAHETPGGGGRTLPLTLPGFLHDPCSTVHPLGAASPCFRAFGLESQGLTWVSSPAALAHVREDGSVLTLERSIQDTAAQLGPDARAYCELVEPFVRRFDELVGMILGPPRLPCAPLLLARFGWFGLRSMQLLARARFEEPGAGALLGGIAAHGTVPLDAAATASFALVLGTAGHRVGWPIAKGGSRSIVDALLRHLRSLGAELELGWSVKHLSELPAARAYLFDLTPRQLVQIAGDALPSGYRRRLQRYRYGPGVFKIDWALDAPIPWRDARCKRASTVHLWGDLPQVSSAVAQVHAGRIPERPLVLLVQPTLFDPTRAPPGKHVAWAYCLVPSACPRDLSREIEAQIERFAPGFGDTILARATRTACDLQHYNANCIGGDIAGGATDWRQLFFRPVARVDPYATPNPKLFLCSSSTPPGGGVHGMCGHFAAQSALQALRHRP